MDSYPPANWGARLLPAVIDAAARDTPARAWASLPVDDWDLAKGFEDITYLAFANAINKLAWFIEDSIGKSPAGAFETIAYLGVPDIRYHAMQMAASKTGYKVLFSSHLNSTAIHVDLMRQTECRTLFGARGVHLRDLVIGFNEQLEAEDDEKHNGTDHGLRHFVIPELDDLLDTSSPATAYPYTKTFAEAEFDPFLVLHSSGTTGFPKPVTFNHAALAALDRHHLLPDMMGRPHVLDYMAGPNMGSRFLMTTPPFHAMSAVFVMAISVFGGSVFLPGFRHRATAVTDAGLLLEHARPDKLTFTPWMMEEVARRPDADRLIRPLKWAGVTGAVTSEFASAVWARHTNYQNLWGTTETLSPPVLRATPDEHGYAVFDLEYSGVVFRDAKTSFREENGNVVPLYEPWFTLTEKSAPYAVWHQRQGIVPGRPGVKEPYPEFATGDLWTPHPDPERASYVWRFIGRTDDLITFATGINVHPGPMESAILRHALVRGAMLVGNGRQQAVGLIELAEAVKAEDEDEAGTRIWEEVIEPQNELIQSHGRISRTHLTVLPAGSFIRTPKGNQFRGVCWVLES